MNALVVGYGSIGSRHARILKELGCRTAVLSKRDINFQPHYRNLEEAIEKESPEYVVVANATNEHYETLTELKKTKFKGFALVEKPLFSKEEQFSPADFQQLFVAYNLRFHPLLKRLRDILRNEKVISAQCYVGQYLPEWRPSADYRQGYSASKQQGGGSLRDLSHELDYLLWMLGPWTDIAAVGGHYSHLEIKTDDVFCILMSTARCSAVTIQLNYLDRCTNREILVNTDRHTFKADLFRGLFQIDKEAPEQLQLERDLMYRLEHKAILDSSFEGLCTFDEGMQVLKMIAAIETSALKKKWITNRGVKVEDS